MARAEETLRLYGTMAPPTPARTLHAGRLEVQLECGNLRHIRYDGVEVLRAISYIIRDRDWGTSALEISGLHVEEQTEQFHISYDGVCRNGDARLVVQAEIVGHSDGRLRFDVKATAEGEFETNRCGFNVLHPISGVAGEPVNVEHCDGTIEDTIFPDLIEPWQPFKSIRALTHKPAPHLSAVCRMEGDVFEMEDQRNWSDASYKTYVRPLELPWPYFLSNGETDTQSVDLCVSATSRRLISGTDPNSEKPITVKFGDQTDLVFPKVGLVVSPAELDDTLANIAELRAISPQAIMCHFDPRAGHARQHLAGFATLQRAYSADYELEYVAVCNGALNDEFANLRNHIDAAGLRLDTLVVCPSVDRGSTPPGSAWPECPPLEAVYKAARNSFPEISLGGGMVSYFTELNRKRPPIALLDFVTHGTNPIVHAADDVSVMETLETLPHITRSARAIIGEGKDYRLGLTGIGMRQNPYGSKTFENPKQDRVCMTDDDPRQRGLFAAAWTVGFAANIASAGITRWVPAAFTGARGLLASGQGGLSPVGKAVADLCRLSGNPTLRCDVSDNKRLAVLAVAGETHSTCLAANLTNQEIVVDFGEVVSMGAFEVRNLSIPSH